MSHRSGVNVIHEWAMCILLEFSFCVRDNLPLYLVSSGRTVGSKYQYKTDIQAFQKTNSQRNPDKPGKVVFILLQLVLGSDLVPVGIASQFHRVSGLPGFRDTMHIEVKKKKGTLEPNYLTLNLGSTLY